MLDASSAVVQAGVLRTVGGAHWRSATTDANEAIFTCAQDALQEAGLSVDRVGAFVYCGGPGSMLGVRTIAMALRTWLVIRPRPCFRYISLTVAGRAEWRRKPRSFGVAADARRDGWHLVELAQDGSAGGLRRVATADFPAGEVVTPAGFRRWAAPPRPLAEISYEVGAALAALPDEDLFSATPEPEALAIASPGYVKWSPQIHRAPAAPT